MNGSDPMRIQGGADLRQWTIGEDQRDRLRGEREQLRSLVDREHLARADLAWTRQAYVEGFLFGYDSAWYDHQRGQFDIHAFLDDGQTHFGGYDVLVLWQPYPRMGVDGRSQIDFWRDWPGGGSRVCGVGPLGPRKDKARRGADHRPASDHTAHNHERPAFAGLRRLIDQCHERGVRCLLNHVRWDLKRSYRWDDDARAFAAVLRESRADGIYVDTKAAAPPALRQALDQVRPGLALETENNAPLGALSVQSSSWSQGHRPQPLCPFVQRWIDPRFMIRSVDRGARDRRALIGEALFWGQGLCVWENIFGWWNPFPAASRALAIKVVTLLRGYRQAFVDPNWEPLASPLAEGVFANRFTHADQTVFTLLNTTGQHHAEVPLAWSAAMAEQSTAKPVNDDLDSGSNVAMAANPSELSSDRPTVRIFDVWHGKELFQASQGGGEVAVSIEPWSCGMIVVQPADRPWPTFAPRREVYQPHQDMQAYPDPHQRGAWRITANTGQAIEHFTRPANRSRELVEESDFRRPVTPLAMEARPVAPAICPTDAGSDNARQMVRLPGGRFVMSVRHLAQKQEGGCYDDPQSLAHPPHYHWLKPIWIDRTEVTRAAYARFLKAEGYCPGDLSHFLETWIKADPTNPATWSPPEGYEDHPVVWVDLEDARAYARWAGKRLAREEEWQFAAQGFDRRLWPWGDHFEPGRCNHDSDETTAVGAWPGGASAFGVLDLAGNVWEWTESQRDDGHSRYAILRGGSHLIQHPGDHPEGWGKMWYAAQGAQPNDAHQKMLLIAPSLDRCATIGFRCVQDEP